MGVLADSRAHGLNHFTTQGITSDKSCASLLGFTLRQGRWGYLSEKEPQTQIYAIEPTLGWITSGYTAALLFLSQLILATSALRLGALAHPD